MRKFNIRENDERQGFLSVIPVILVLFAIRGYPLLIGVFKSFTNWNGMSQSTFIGAKNYITILKDPVFWNMLGNNLVFMVFIFFQLLFGITAAILFYQETPGWKIFRSLFYLPQIVSSVVIGYLFTVVFSYRGPLNVLLQKTGLEKLSMDWLGDRSSAIVIIILCLVWVNIGWQAMLGLGGLSSISPSILEAADIDGAGYWQKLFGITLPLLGRTIEYSTVISVIWVLTGLFPFIFSMTDGGPGYGTTTIDYMIYLKSFRMSSELGYASALAVILTVIVLLLTVIEMKMSNRANSWEE